MILAGLTSGYVTDYRAFRTTQPAEPRYPRQESISGIGSAVAASRHKPETAWLEQFAATDPSLTHILMSHHPEYFPLVPKEIDLILSGHAHGGQLRMYNPFKREWLGLWSPRSGLVADVDAGRVRRETGCKRRIEQYNMDTEDRESDRGRVH